MRKVSRPKAGNESLSNQAYQQVRDEILSGELSIGDVLSRRWLTERLSMSFLTITEALNRLETEGVGRKPATDWDTGPNTDRARYTRHQCHPGGTGIAGREVMCTADHGEGEETASDQRETTGRSA